LNLQVTEVSAGITTGVLADGLNVSGTPAPKAYRNFFKKARRADKVKTTIDSTARNGDSNVQRRRFQTAVCIKTKQEHCG
jgi:hypothetical protein